MTQLPPVQWLLLLAAVIGLLVRWLKSDKLNVMLASLSLPPVPKRALPWVAGALGVASGVLDAALKGASWPVAVQTAVLGLIVGGFATWGHEAMVESAAGGRELGGPDKPPSALDGLSDATVRAIAAMKAAEKVPVVVGRVEVDGEQVAQSLGVSPILTAKDLAGTPPPAPSSLGEQVKSPQLDW